MTTATLAPLAAAQLGVDLIPPSDPDTPRYLPFELKLRHSTSYQNPFWDVDVTARFTSPGGATYEVEGFYYDTGLWMVRFAPLIEGPWRYAVTMTAPGGSFEATGGFACVPSGLHGPIRVDPDNPERFLRDDGAAFNAVGTNFFTYQRPSINGAWTAPPESEVDERWSVYFETYRSHGGNVWRRMIGNEGAGDLLPFGGELGIWHDDGVDRYSLPRALALDVEFRQAREHDMVVIAALLNGLRNWDRNPLNACNGGPFPAPQGDCSSNGGYPSDFLTLGNTVSATYHRKYFRYMAARYSAFVDIWELFNEFDDVDEAGEPPAHGLDVPWKMSMAQYLRLKHPYHDLIATTRLRNAASVPDAWQDVHVSHCYSYDARADLCALGCGHDPHVCAQNVDALISSIPKVPGKPDLIDEFGFSHDTANDDPDHHRIGLWAALHQDTGVVFWDANSRIDCNSPLDCLQLTNSSAYLSDASRDSIFVLQRYAAALPHTVHVATTQPRVTPENRVRAFGLASRRAGVYSAYVHHHDDHTTTMSSASITLEGLVNELHEALWVNPRTGATRSSFTFSGPQLVAAIPAFAEDIALLVRPAAPVRILTTSLPPPAHRAPSYMMLEARGGARPYTWRITSGALPFGMTLDAESGLISGTARYGGSHRFTVEVSAQPLVTGGGVSTDQMELAIQWTDVFESIAEHDGIVMESSRDRGVGGSVYSSIPTKFGLGAGDYTRDRQGIGIVSFETSSIPDLAVIDSAKVVLTCDEALQGNPLSFRPLYLDIKTGSFGAGPGLDVNDFQAAATVFRAASHDLFAGQALPQWPVKVSLQLDPAGRGAVNRTGLTQCRLHLGTPTDGDGLWDGLGFCPGEYADKSLRPKLVITYH